MHIIGCHEEGSVRVARNWWLVVVFFFFFGVRAAPVQGAGRKVLVELGLWPMLWCLLPLYKYTE